MPNARSRWLAILLAALLLATLAACGGDDGDDSAADDDGDTTEETTGGDDESAAEGDGLSGSDDDTIVIEGSAFTVRGPVKQNEAVSINNKDSFAHTVTMDEGDGFDVPVDGGEGEVFLAVQEPGTYPFHCEIHPSMKGELVVEPA